MSDSREKDPVTAGIDKSSDSDPESPEGIVAKRLNELFAEFFDGEAFREEFGKFSIIFNQIRKRKEETENISAKEINSFLKAQNDAVKNLEALLAEFVKNITFTQDVSSEYKLQLFLSATRVIQRGLFQDAIFMAETAWLSEDGDILEGEKAITEIVRYFLVIGAEQYNKLKFDLVYFGTVPPGAVVSNVSENTAKVIKLGESKKEGCTDAEKPGGKDGMGPIHWKVE